jgi:hypothetical protein
MIKNSKENLLTLLSLFQATLTQGKNSQIQGNTSCRQKRILNHLKSQLRLIIKIKVKVTITSVTPQRTRKRKNHYIWRPIQWMNQLHQVNTFICLRKKIKKSNSCRIKSVWRRNLTRIRNSQVWFWINQLQILRQRDLSVHTRMLVSWVSANSRHQI